MHAIAAMENRRHWKGRCASDWRGVCACTVCVEQNLRREREIHVVPLCGYMNFGVDVAKNRATKYLRYLRYCERLQSLAKNSGKKHTQNYHPLLIFSSFFLS